MKGLAVLLLCSPSVLGFMRPALPLTTRQLGPLKGLGMGDADNLDFPSDTSSEDMDAPEAMVAAVTDLAREPQRAVIKCRLYQVAAKTNRGQWADIEQKNDVINMVAQLESLAPQVPSELEGRWELLYSDVAPFRVSPFFLTVGKLIGDSQASEDFFRLHRLATSSGEVGKVSQLITKQELVSEVEISTGIPSIPFEISGTVVSRASLIKDPDNSLRLMLKSTGVRGASLFSFFNDGDLPELPIGDLYSSLGALPEVRLSTFYCDGDLRISRTDDEHFFVFTRSTL